MQAARQTVQQAQSPVAPQGMPQAPTMPQKSNLPVPPPGVALQLAKQAQSMPPLVLGTLIWRGLQQHGQAVGNLTKHFGGQPQMPMGS